MIEIKHLSKVWPDGGNVLHDINLTISDGDVFALVGRSGAGKSTLLRCINALTDYQEGSLTVDGQEVREMNGQELRELRKKCGMIFQQFSLLERKTVYENVALPMRCWKKSKKEIDEKVRSLLDLVGLGDKADARPRNLSGGQKQRVAIARALTMEPDILLCDEATSALDPNTTNSILDLLDEINQKTGITIIIVTHQMEVVRRACRKACILEHGEIVYNGDVQSVLMDKPPALGRLLGDSGIPLPEGGRNIRMAVSRREEDHTDSFFHEMAQELPVRIVDGNVQQFKDGILSVFTINVEEKDYDAAAAFLNERKIRWKEVFRKDDQGDDEEGM